MAVYDILSLARAQLDKSQKVSVSHLQKLADFVPHLYMGSSIIDYAVLIHTSTWIIHNFYWYSKVLPKCALGTTKNCSKIYQMDLHLAWHAPKAYQVKLHETSLSR